MSSAAVTPAMRTLGWNIELLATRRNVVFGGVFQPADRAFMTFRDIVDEMRLCFEIQDENANTVENAWDDVAFSLVDTFRVPESDTPFPQFVHGSGLDQRVPSLPQQEPAAPNERAVVQYSVLSHGNCSLPADQPSKSHLQAGCARHILKPVRRLEPRYLPPKKASSDPRLAAYPLRNKARGRKPASPTKRSSDGSVSPRKDPDMDPEEDPSSMVAPLDCDISEDRAKATMASFRQSCLLSAGQCAITGMGRSWCINPAIGPALQACHIVPQKQYHTYPDEAVDCEEAAPVSSRRLMQAWERTWAPDNAILLFSHLHELFDSRLFSIHPETLKIRVFMPYDILLGYHGCDAKLTRSVDRAALRHHYEMCCIENMAAKMPFVEQNTWSGSVATSGINSPLEMRPKLAKVAKSSRPESPSQPQSNDSQDVQNGDPSKRTRQAEGLHVPDLTGDCTDDAASLSSVPSSRMDEVDCQWSRKRKRPHPAHEAWIAASHDSYITPENCGDFLADVDWELMRVARRRLEQMANATAGNIGDLSQDNSI